MANREGVLTLPKVKSANSSKTLKQKSQNRKDHSVGRKEMKALTRKELDDLGNKLEGKRPMCWKIVSERFAKQYVMKHYKTHRQVFCLLSQLQLYQSH